MARFWIVVLVVLCMSPTTWADPPRMIDPGSVAEGRRLVATVAAAGNFQLVQATPREFSLGLVEGNNVHPSGVLHLQRNAHDNVPRFRSRSFSMDISNFSPDTRIIERLVRAAWLVAGQDGGASENRHVHQATSDLGPLRTATFVFVGLALLLGVLRRGQVIWEPRLPDLLPAFTQATLLAYWSIYWPGVRDHVPSMLLQLAMAFAADALFSFARFGSWRVDASPFPVVLSINLFAWFTPFGATISILTAFATKAMVHRNGRHVLNPSATGLAIAGLFSYLAPQYVPVGDLFHAMGVAPNITELLLLLALIPQVRFRILPVTIAAVIALRLSDNPGVSRLPVLLALALLGTDPSTLPQTDTGKVMFGLLMGFGMVFIASTLRHFRMMDDFAMVMSIPLVNAVAPDLDRLGVAVLSGGRRVGDWLQARWPATGPKSEGVRETTPFDRPVPNIALVAGWLLLMVLPLGVAKSRAFEPSFHWNWGTPLIVRDADDVPRCASNPAFCRPFTFVQEASLWRDRARASFRRRSQ